HRAVPSARPGRRRRRRARLDPGSATRHASRDRRPRRFSLLRPGGVHHGGGDPDRRWRHSHVAVVRFRLRYLVIPLLLLGLVAAVFWAIPTNAYVFAPDRARPLASFVRLAGAHPAGGGDIYYVDALISKASLLER